MRANDTRILAILIDGDFLFVLPVASRSVSPLPIGKALIIFATYVNFVVPKAATEILAIFHWRPHTSRLESIVTIKAARNEEKIKTARIT